jgi:diguanylate cyclase (GGDEF)-like protein
LKAQTDLLRKWVYADGLTGAFSRSHFDEHLATEWSRAVRNDSALSAVLLDIDFFKRYNERHGHQAGDDSLRRLASGLKTCLKRPADMVARFGGDEFVCLLPDTDLAGALVVASELRAAVHALQMEHADSPTAALVTVSLGVCCRPSRANRPSTGAEPGSAASLIRGAEAQLLLAKSSGRDQACGGEMVASVNDTTGPTPTP